MNLFLTKTLLPAGLLALALSPVLAHDRSHLQARQMVAQAETPMGMPAATIGNIELSGAFTRATLPNAPVAGGFVSISNTGSTDDTLIAATSPVAGEVQLHEMKMEGDVMKMQELPGGIPVPAGQTVMLKPGGLHLMFMQLKQPLVEGNQVPVTLTFEKAGTVELLLDVGGAAAKAPAMHTMHGG
jgi:copper(I)-binding protein